MLVVPLTPDPSDEAAPQDRLAFKAYEIEELADVYFFRPAGMVFARLARRLGATPTSVTGISMIVGAVGAVLLAWPPWAVAGFALIIFYSVLDSSDGQLARMTGQATEFGRLLDGIGGYVVYAVIYAVLLLGPAATVPVPLIVAAILSNIAHAQMYDYHRTAYIEAVIDRHASRHAGVRVDQRWAAALLELYLRVQRLLIGTHARVEEALRSRAADGRIREADAQRYRQHFYWPVRGWNLMGDNTRFYAIGLLASIGRLDWLFVFLAVPMNVAFAALWLWQMRADRRFLNSL